ncbi:hypothetical protein [Azospirillum thermophilum]|uniref:hypothetical protein n=1 Tax=Azospirillum thermophilum TaxID=2202148 RepID=UPI001FE93B3C|nr:hypothetical protein [Azospirillum thermophilum]
MTVDGEAGGGEENPEEGKTPAEEGKARAPSGPDAAKRKAWEDEARDALHILPLSAIPLETPGLQHARLIKNVRLQTVVEMFRDAQAGSGQVSPSTSPPISNPTRRRWSGIW